MYLPRREFWKTSTNITRYGTSASSFVKWTHAYIVRHSNFLTICWFWSR